MTLTPEQLRQNAAAMLAFADGKPIESRSLGYTKWHDQYGPLWQFEDTEYRPKPEPKVRPWSKPEDVPGPVCWVRMQREDHLRGDAEETSLEALVLAISTKGLTFITAIEQFLPWNLLPYRGLEYSTDRLNWRKCEVEEPA